jgi:hypothetical protein
MPIDDEIRTILGGPVPRRTASSRSVRKTLLAVERVSANVNTASGVSLRFKPRRQCTSPKKTHPKVREGCNVAREANNFDMQRCISYQTAWTMDDLVDRFLRPDAAPRDGKGMTPPI